MTDNCSSRRTFLKNVAAAAGSPLLSFCSRAPGGSSASGTSSPLAGKRIRWIVPHESGGGYDTISRLIASHLSAALQATIMVESRGGAGGLIGAQEIQHASPDGLTIGILNASGLMTPLLSGDSTVPNPFRDFTVLCRVSRSRHVWAASSESPLKTAADVLELSRRRPVIFPINDIGSESFISTTLPAKVLEIPIQIVAGYQGSPSGILAALRGEVDLVSYNTYSLFTEIKNGELRPLLQISDEPSSVDTAFRGVPLFAGHDGLAVDRARRLGHDMNAAQAEANAIATLIGVGRLVVAPPGMDPALSDLLIQKMDEVLRSSALRSISERSNLDLDFTDGKTALAEFTPIANRIDQFVPIIQSAIQRIRQ
jgi:tripartite-type tricarboxylate transporter receptor subunit TctC